MSTTPPEDPETAAIEQLEQFGLSAYAARTFVALASLGTGTARDVSQVSETTCGRFERDFQHRTDILQTTLSELEPAERRAEQRGVGTVDGQTAVADRVLEFFASAEEGIVYMTVEDHLTEDVIDALSEAAERGVSIKLGGISSDVQERIQDEIPGATTFESLWVWSDTSAGRLMMVDGRKTLVSALVNGKDASVSDPRSETAIRGEGEANSLVVVLKAIFTWRLETIGSD